jgi:cobalamin biosynthesis protein CobT
MATENIIVEQKNVPTAYFNVTDRVLVVPTLKDEIGPTLYDLFMGHEVGHALFTPADGWHDSIKEMGVNRSILNVCEDARIEKLICRKYPGLKSSFIKSYKELLSKDFFGVKDLDTDLLKFIDRVNLHTKCGLGAGVSFKDEELPLLNEVMGTETWEQVVEVAKKIQDYMKEQLEEAKIKIMEKDEGGQGEDLDDEGQDEDQQQADMEGQSEFKDYDEEEQQGKSNKAVRDEQSAEGDQELDAETDIKFRENEKELYDYNSKDRIYANIPDIDHNDFIIGFKQMYKEIRDENETSYDSKFIGKQKIDTKKFIEFRNSTNKVVAYLAKEFELRKNALLPI